MTKNSTSKLEPFDLEIEGTFHKLRNLVEKKLSPKNQLVEMEETPAPIGPVGAVGVENPRTLMKYVQPSIDETKSCIRKPQVQANNFELKPSYVNMIQNSVQFHTTQ